MAKRFKKVLAIIMALILTMTVGLNAFAIDLTGGIDQNGENWTWNEAEKNLTLNGANVNEGFVLVDGSNVIVSADSIVNGGDNSAFSCEGTLSISGSDNKLTLTGSNGISAESVVIENTEVDIDAGSCGIYVYNEEGDANVTLENVEGSITGGYAGIYVQGECSGTDASVEINNSDLEVTSEATSWNNRARKSGITVYTSKAEKVDGSISINDSKVVATGYDAGLSINNYVGDADATNDACSTININNSTVVAEGTSGTWAGIFASVLGQHEDADTTINIVDSSVYAVSPNTGILTSSQKGESKIVLDNSILGASGKTALSMIEETSQKQVAELKNGSTYVQMTPDAVMKGEIANFDGKTIIATEGEGITYDRENNYFVIPQGSVVIENFTDGTSVEYRFENQAGGVGGFNYAKEEVWGFDVPDDNGNDDPIIEEEEEEEDENEPTVIVDEPTPLDDAPSAPEEQYDVPETETIVDEEVPLADVPGLGDDSAIWMLVAAFAVFSLVVINLPERKGKRN